MVCELGVEDAVVYARDGCDSSFRHMYGARIVIEAAKHSQMRCILCNERIERVLGHLCRRIGPTLACHLLILETDATYLCNLSY